MAPSIHCAILLLGCTSWLAAALPVSGRTLLQADADIVAQDQFEPVFQLVRLHSLIAFELPDVILMSCRNDWPGKQLVLTSFAC